MTLQLCGRRRTHALRFSDSARLATQTLRSCYSGESTVMRSLQIWCCGVAHPLNSGSKSTQQRLKVPQVGSTAVCRRLKVAKSASLSAQCRGCSVANHHRPRRNLCANIPKSQGRVHALTKLNIRRARSCVADECRKVGRPASRNGRQCRSCLLYTSPSPRDKRQSRMPSSA